MEPGLPRAVDVGAPLLPWGSLRHRCPAATDEIKDSEPRPGTRAPRKQRRLPPAPRAGLTCTFRFRLSQKGNGRLTARAAAQCRSLTEAMPWGGGPAPPPGSRVANSKAREGGEPRGSPRLLAWASRRGMCAIPQSNHATQCGSRGDVPESSRCDKACPRPPLPPPSAGVSGSLKVREPPSF